MLGDDHAFVVANNQVGRKCLPRIRLQVAQRFSAAASASEANLPLRLKPRNPSFIRSAEALRPPAIQNTVSTILAGYLMGGGLVLGG